jgi:chromatin segregation and condensation protein Rec8/ScpA/Scc1 (kleisin family)
MRLISWTRHRGSEQVSPIIVGFANGHFITGFYIYLLLEHVNMSEIELEQGTPLGQFVLERRLAHTYCTVYSFFVALHNLHM